MKSVVLLKMVPDVIEELEVGADGKSLDLDSLRLIANERDSYALEEALLLKERHGGTVVAVAPDAPEVDDVLFTALARGADRAVKITEIEPEMSTGLLAVRVGESLLASTDLLPADLILTGCQAIDDLDGLLGPLVARQLRLPYLGLVSKVELDSAASKATVWKEYPAGVHGEFEITLPAVLGIQAAEKPLRYVPVAKVRAAMKSQKIECLPVPTMAESGPPLVEVFRMAKPEAAGHAEMLEGSPGQIAGMICAILAGRGLL